MCRPRPEIEVGITIDRNTLNIRSPRVVGGDKASRRVTTAPEYL